MDNIRILNFDTSDMPELNRADTFFQALHEQVDSLQVLFNNLYEAESSNIYGLDSALITIFSLQGGLIRGDL